MTKYDVERIAEGVLSRLRLEVINGDFTNPNQRTILLKLDNIEIDRAYFDVIQKREYED